MEFSSAAGGFHLFITLFLLFSKAAACKEDVEGCLEPVKLHLHHRTEVADANIQPLNYELFSEKAIKTKKHRTIPLTLCFYGRKLRYELKEIPSLARDHGVYFYKDLGQTKYGWKHVEFNGYIKDPAFDSSIRGVFVKGIFLGDIDFRPTMKRSTAEEEDKIIREDEEDFEIRIASAAFAANLTTIGRGGGSSSSENNTIFHSFIVPSAIHLFYHP